MSNANYPMGTSMVDEQEQQDPKVVEIPSTGMLATMPQNKVRVGIADLLPPIPVEGRNIKRLSDEAKRIGQQFGGALDAQGKSRAIYSFPAGKSVIEGPTVWLIESLMQSYGHCATQLSVQEEGHGRVTITSTIIDRLNGTVYQRDHIATLAPPPARFASKPDQMERWNAMQLQSAVSKASRTTMQHALPAWYVDAAVSAAREAMSSKLLKNKDGSVLSLGQAIQNAVDWFSTNQQVKMAQLEELIGIERPMWTLAELAYLRETSARLHRGEVALSELFPSKVAETGAKDDGVGLDAVKGA